MTAPRARVSILGASGYAGQELVRLVGGHPQLELAGCMTARPDHTPGPPALPTDPVVDALDLEALETVDGAFLCTPHGRAAELVVAALERDCKVVDLSADFRLRDPATYARTYGLEHGAKHLLPEAVYGLTEPKRDAVRAARLVANPGCYPTSILLPLLPLLADGLVAAGTTIIADSKSGISGAGKTPTDRNVYGAAAENFLAYGVRLNVLEFSGHMDLQWSGFKYDPFRILKRA